MSTKSTEASVPQLSVPWVESPFFDRELGRRTAAGLTSEQARLASEYHTQGYVAFRQAVPTELCHRLRTQLEPLYEGNERAAQERRIQDAWQQGVDAARELAVNPAVLDLLEMLYERRPVPFQTLDFKWGTEQRGHSDCVHFSCIPARYMCGVWVALEDVGSHNGPLFYYPGSHRLPEVTPFDLGQTIDHVRYGEYEDFQEQLMATLGFEPVEFHAKTGDVLVWSSNILHGGRPVHDVTSTRWSQVTHYYFEGGVYYTPFYSDTAFGELLLKEVVDLTTLEVVDHTFNGRQLMVSRLANGRSHVALAGEDSEPLVMATMRHDLEELQKQLAEVQRHSALAWEEAARAQEEIGRIRQSLSYRVGHGVLEPLRLGRRALGGRTSSP